MNDSEIIIPGMRTRDIIKAANLCELAYESIDEINDHLGRTATAIAIESGNAFGFIARSNKSSKVDIVFRGTNDPLDAIKDADIVQTYNHVFADVHRGVLSEWLSLKGQILSTLRTADKVTVSGHSLGGGIATLCMAELRMLELVKETQGVTFGSLMVFGETGAEKFYDLPIVNVRNAKDRVPSLPSYATRVIYTMAYRKTTKKQMDTIPPYYRVGTDLWLTPGHEPRPARACQYSGHKIKRYNENCKTELLTQDS